MSERPPSSSMPDWRDPEAPDTNTGLQAALQSEVALQEPTKTGLASSYFQQCELAWSEFLLTPGYAWMKKGGGFAAFILFTVFGQSLYTAAAWLFPFLPVYGWVLTLFATTLLAQAFVIHYARLGHVRREVLADKAHEIEVKRLAGELSASEQRFAELTKEKLIFEVEERESRIYLQEHPNQPLVVTAQIKMRFRNKVDC